MASIGAGGRSAIRRLALAVAVAAAGLVAGAAGPAAAAPGCAGGAAPTAIAIETIPVVPGAIVRLDDQPVVLSKKGTGSVLACKVTDASRVAGPEEPIELTPILRARYTRVFISQGGRKLQLAFATDYRVGVTFTGLPPESVDSWTVKSSTGEEKTYTSRSPQWMQASRVLRGANGLEERQIYQTIEKVLVNGVNVVVKSQVKFLPSQTQSVRVPLLAFDLQIYVVDRVFGFKIGKSVTLSGEGRPTLTMKLKNGEATMLAVPRGDYLLTADAPGLKLGRPLTVSKDQQVVVPVLTYLDIAALIGSPLVLAIALILAPRPKMRAQLMQFGKRLIPARRSAPPSTPAATADAPDAPTPQATSDTSEQDVDTGPIPRFIPPI